MDLDLDHRLPNTKQRIELHLCPAFQNESIFFQTRRLIFGNMIEL